LPTATSARIIACGGISTPILTNGDQIIITCGSVSEQIVSGPIFINFSGQDSACAAATTTIETGNALTFYPETCTFVAPSTNTDTIIVNVGSTQIPIVPNAKVRPVPVDVKPGTNNPSTISLKNDKTIAVAILGNSNFNVNSIDKTLSTLKFGDSLTATPAQATKVSIGDVNADGLKDLVAQFKLSETNISSGDALGCMVGKLAASSGGTTIQGCDAIRVIKG
jgi:hypothetical protein